MFPICFLCSSFRDCLSSSHRGFSKGLILPFTSMNAVVKFFSPSLSLLCPALLSAGGAPPAVEAVVWAYVAGRRWRCWAACSLCAAWACWGSPSAPTTGFTWKRVSYFPSTRARRYACPSTLAYGESASSLVSWRLAQLTGLGFK